MMILLYNLGWFFFNILVRIAAPFNTRAALLKKGRSEIWTRLSKLDKKGEVIWVHCASLGEFEQGRPLIEAIRRKKPEDKIVLTFFSPSGYEIRKDYEMADLVIYLPSDTRRNARRFILEMNPGKVYFVKYEFWFHYFRELKEAGIPLYSVSAIFRDNQVFFKWYGQWFRKLLHCVTRFYVQDEKSAQLLNSIGLSNYVVAGDTRFDRVTAIAASAAEVPVAAEFSKNARVLVAGSTWPADEMILAEWFNHSSAEEKLIIAPHEVHESHISELIQRFKVPVVRFSRAGDHLSADTKVLIIDTIGMLSAIYRYGTIAYIGGGFGKGIHNTLEAATYGMPVIFGPKYLKFKEAVDLLESGAGFSIRNKEDFDRLIHQLWHNSEPLLQSSGRAAKEYVVRMQGATELIVNETL